MGTLPLLKRGTPFLPVLLVFAMALPALAAEQAYTLPQVVAYALQHNGELNAFREEKGLRDAGKTRAGLLPNPVLDLETRTGALTGSSDELSLTLGISQEFSLAGKRDKRLKLAEQELEMYRWQLADRERLLRAEAKSAFYAAIHAIKLTELADRAIKLNQQLLDVTRERLAAGDIAELEMNLVKVELARSEGARIAALKADYQSRARLRTFMGLPVGASPAISGSLEAEPPMTRSLAELQQLANANRPDRKALESEKNRGEADVMLAQAEAVPNLTAGFFYAHERSADATGAGEEKVRDNLIGIRLSLPIPLFDKNQAGVQEARARRSSSESRLSAAGRNIEQEVETAYSSYLNSEKILALYKSNIIPQLEENLQLTQEAYRIGEAGIMAVIQEQKKFLEVSEGYLTALHDRQTALVQLEAAVATDINGGVQ